MDVSIIIPAHNEEKNIDLLYREISEVMSKRSRSYEIIIIDDGSTDSTFEKIKKIAAKDKKVKGISFHKNFKKSAAYMAGFKTASGKIIITMDADLQDEPKEIPKFLIAIRKWDLVVGWKHERKDPFFKRFPSKIFNYLNYAFFGIRLHDSDCGYRAMKAEVLQDLNLYGDHYRYIPALLSEHGYKITELKVKHNKRRFGKSKYGITRLLTGALDLLTVKFLKEYKERPLHIFGGTGALSFVLGIFAEFYVLYYKFFRGEPFAQHLAMLIFGVLLLILGVQLVGIGLIGELISSHKNSSVKYRIRETVN
ncbi:MAG: glycosyltransferase family 2 protein [Nanoarchaeota archaeon]|nr:glycosyltransferase family 2 protein [Nanoarchaeota archaeon]